MKKLITISTVILLTASVFAQSPQKMSYQAVIRKSTGVLATNQAVGMQISILQGTPAGSVVYKETHTIGTNANGLAGIAIGTGTVISGNFATIDWSNGPFFIKTETDPNGGTNYTINATTQLLSVPYALHANTADSVTGGIAETDPQFNNSVAKGITATDTSNWNNKLSTHYIGEYYGGGIVFWVDSSGQHGLIVSVADLSTAIVWGPTGPTNAKRFGINAGISNTERIYSIHTDGSNYAAKMCYSYQGANYGDWYLPSVFEFTLLYQQKAAVVAAGAASLDHDYWSSTEEDPFSAWYYDLNGNAAFIDLKSNPQYVRAIRAF